MNTKKKVNPFGVKVLADKPVISIDKSCTRIIEIIITPPAIEEKKVRPALNLSLVLDRSGSMQGEKLHFVKQAATHVLDLLGPQDRASVTIFDDQVETIFPAANMNDDNKLTARQSLARVRSGSSTFLSGGWLRGCKQAAEGDNGHTLNRTLLLTDGLANVGERDSNQLGRHAREIFRGGVSTSCFGVGHGYDEHLLETMANNGGGNFHFLETMNAIPLVFEREFEELTHTSLRDTVIIIQLHEHIHAEVSAGYQVDRNKDELKIQLGNLYAGKPKSIFVQLNFKKGMEAGKINIPVTIQGRDETDTPLSAESKLEVNPVPSNEEKSTAEDKPLMERFATVDMADKANEALKREKAGDRQGAHRIMRESMTIHSPNMPSAMQEKYKHLSTEMLAGMDEGTRKRRHFQEYQGKRGREERMDYTLRLVNGHPVFQLDGQETLLDSGSPFSLGRKSDLYFMNAVHPLSQEFMGVDLETIGHLVGTRLDLMVGADILLKYRVLLNLPNGLIQFSQPDGPGFGNRVPLRMMAGVPIATCLVSGKEIQAAFDTGSKLCYINSKLIKDLASIGKEKDFYPGMGEFETKVYEVPFEIGGMELSLRCGVLPATLEAALGLTGAQGILGVDLLQKFEIWLNLPEGEMYMHNAS
ncbi:MAG: VWA domain-containing protein [Chloroflexota bacterium]